MKKTKVIIYIVCAFIMAFFTKEFDIIPYEATNSSTDQYEDKNSIVVLNSDEKPSAEISDDTNLNTDNNILKIHVIDVGQADSIFIELPTKESMLIDAGNNSDDDLVVDYIKSLSYDKIDYVIGTHPHEDHIGGLDTVINTFEIGKVYLPKAQNNTKTFEDVILSIKNKNLKINTAVAGVNIINGDDLKVNIISPQNKTYEDFNHYSAVIKLEYGNNSFVLMGDAEKINEEEITWNVDVDVIKIGHHGSNTSSSEEFIKKVSPKYAIISVGKDNEYGHPHEETLNLLKKIDADVYRTDEFGTITILSDGKNIEVEK